MTPEEIEAAMAVHVPKAAAPKAQKMTPVVALVDPGVTVTKPAALPAPLCKICRMPVNTSADIKAQSSEQWVHKTCLDLRRESHRQSLRFDANVKVGSLLHSLPQSRGNDDAAMLKVSAPKLVKWHAGWTSESKLSLLALGLSGSCKTLSLAATLRANVASAVDDYVDHDGNSSALNWMARANFVTAFNLCEATRQHPLGQGEAPEVTKAKRASLLILDDLGNENLGFEKWLLSIIDARISANLPTWVTSGFPVDDLTLRYGQSLVRRICEKGVGTLIDLFRAGAQLKAVR